MAKTSELVVTDWANQPHFGWGSLVTTSGKNLVIQATPAYPNAWPATTWDLSDSHIAVELIGLPNLGGGAVSANLGIYDSVTFRDMYLGWENNQLRVAVNATGTVTYHGYIAYDPVAHRYLRIRETAGTVYFEAGPAPDTFPTVVHSAPTPWTATAVQPYIGAGNWNSVADPGVATWGPVNATAAPATGTPRSGGSAFLKQSDGSWKACNLRVLPWTAVIPQGWTTATVDVDASIRSYKVSTHNNGGTATAKLIARPPQVAVGDLLMNFAVADSSGVANFTPPSGWTQLYELSAGTAGLPRIFCHYKVAVAADTTTTGWNWTTYATGADGASLCVAIRDWSGSTANLRNAISGTGQTAPSVPSVTPATARNLLLSCVASAGPGNVWGWIPPQGAGNVAYGHNGNGYSSVIVAHETYNSTAATGGRTFGLNVAPALNNAKLGIAVAVPSGTATKTITQMLSEYTHTGGSGGDLTDTGNLTFEDSAGTSSTYHLFAEGLDWTKNVGLLVYTDGSGEWGLDPARLDHQYLLGTTTGMRAVARRQNMILLTPKAPGNGCLDGDGVCWYDDSNDGTSPHQKLEWSNELIRYILTRYNIDRRRIAIGGYSSGAQWTTAWWGPRYASDIMLDGVAVAISYGGQPRVAPRLTAAYKTAVEHVWDVGTADTAYTEPTWDDGVQTGRAWYQGEGFAVTDLVLQNGAGHDRASTSPTDFGPIMEREIIARVPPA